MGEMKPNPCKWCGAKAKLRKGQGVYYCPTPPPDCYKNGWELQQDFDTWQKNNPLPSNIENNDDSGKPHQFKAGDWVKVENHGGKYQIDEIGTGEYHVHNKSDQRKWVLEVELTPATRLKRKEISDELKRISDLDDVGWMHESIAKLIEEI